MVFFFFLYRIQIHFFPRARRAALRIALQYLRVFYNAPSKNFLAEAYCHGDVSGYIICSLGAGRSFRRQRFRVPVCGPELRVSCGRISCCCTPRFSAEQKQNTRSVLTERVFHWRKKKRKKIIIKGNTSIVPVAHVGTNKNAKTIVEVLRIRSGLRGFEIVIEMKTRTYTQRSH